MSQHYYGPLYLIARGGSPHPEAKHEGVIETYEGARSHIDVAKELWSLAGDDAKVDAIGAVVRRAFGRDDPVLFAADIDEMLGLLDGLQDALRLKIVDDDWNIRPERMSEVRQRARLIDVDNARGELAEVGVWEGLTRVSALRNILQRARDRGLDVALD